MKIKILHREYWTLVLLIILPFLPYLHVFWKNNSSIWSYISKKGIFKHHFLFFDDLDSFIYHTLVWISVSLLFYLMYRNAAPWVKPFFLFPLYFAASKLFLLMFPQFIKSYRYAFYLVTIIPFILFFLRKLKESPLFFKDSLIKIFFKISICIILVFIPILHESSRFFPDNTSMIQFGFIKVFSYGFEDASMALFTILQKICFLLPILIYFFTKKTWERYIALVPIIIYSAQLVNIFNPNLSSLDEIEIYQTAKFTIPLLGILLLLAKANDHQERIKHWIESQYLEIESIQKKKLLKRQNLINSKRQDIVGANTKVLEKIKTELEQELKSSN